MTIDKFNENCVTNVNDLKIIDCNIRSLYAHHDEFLAILSILCVRFDILCFSESWLADATKQLISFQGYQSFHFLRPINKRLDVISIFLISHDFLPTQSRASHVKSDKTHTQSSRSYLTHEP